MPGAGPGKGPEPVLAAALDAAFRAAAAFRASGRPAPAIRALVPVMGGSINRAYRLETDAGTFFCKWNPDGPGDLFRAERRGLAALGEALRKSGSPLRIPEVVAFRDGDAGGGEGPDPGPVLVLAWLAPAPRGADRAAWEALGRGLADLHRARAERFGFPEDNYCGLTPQENAWTSDWSGFYATRRLGALIRRLEAAGRVGPREGAVFRKLRDRLPCLLGHAPAPSLLHGDLWSGNFLATDQGPALIDPAAYYGDREAEWGMLTLFGGFPEAVLAAYQESWPLPAGWRERLPLYQLYHVLNHQLLFGGGYGDQALSLARRYV